MRAILLTLTLFLVPSLAAQAEETFPPLNNGTPPKSLDEMWGDFDPQKEPLQIETLHEWETDGVILRIVRFHIGTFKSQPAKLAGIYGFPKGQKNLPGLLQIHGGGQYADEQACLANAKRGYATLSIAWAGRISASQYRVNSEVVQLFWDGKQDHPRYRVTTDWGAVDGYHAPSRNRSTVFPSVKVTSSTLDKVESPRNSGWFLCAVAARRGLTFLEKQPEVDAKRLGVYGHSMGGKLTVLTATDPRVKAAAPSCGGISDRYNRSPLFRKTLGDDQSLKKISCPIIFLSPANDFHGRIGDLPKTIKEIKSTDWRVTCSPHHNHQDTPPFEVATLLWFDEHLKQAFTMPATPRTNLILDSGSGKPVLQIQVDQNTPVQSVDVYFTQQGKPDEQPSDNEQVKHRFWHHVKPKKSNNGWIAELPVSSTSRPLWVYANASYALSKPVSGAGYYYRNYTARSFNLSSLMLTASPEQLQASAVIPNTETSNLIEDFQGDWEREWFTYRPNEWARTTHKLNYAKFKAPGNAKLSLSVQADQPNQLVILLDNYAAVVELTGQTKWQTTELKPADFKDYAGTPLDSWSGIKRLKLGAAERLKPGRGQKGKSIIVGKKWQGKPPQFSNLRWLPIK